MRVVDGGRYFETEDVDRLVGNFDLNFQLINAIADALKEMRWKVRKKPSDER